MLLHRRTHAAVGVRRVARAGVHGGAVVGAADQPARALRVAIAVALAERARRVAAARVGEGPRGIVVMRTRLCIASAT